MSDHRRPPPSPFVFSPESVLSPPPPASSANTVSMPFVRRHVTRRLKAAKAECDKELQRVTNNITAFFEERLREADHDADRRDSVVEDLRDEHVSPFQSDDYSSDGGYDAEVESARDRLPHPPPLTHHASSPGLNAASSSQTSPATLRRQNTAPWDRPLSSSVSSSAIAPSPASSNILLPETSLTRKPTNPSPAASPSWGTGAAASRRLSRTIHIVPHTSRSAQSSRSTSRSRSPLPPLSTHASFSEYVPSAPASATRRASRILVDDPVDPIMTALYDLIAVATDITDMSVAQLTAQPKACEALVQRVQSIGKAWDDHPDWHGRNWYVQVLLAVASLSRVVEWWEAEKQFWNFDDNDDEQDEPLMFVTKSVDEPALARSSLKRTDSDLEGFRLNPDDDAGQSPHPPAPVHRERGDEKSASSRSPPVGTPSKDTEPARFLATERLRLQAETAHNQNIVMELSLDGDQLLWINHAWRVVVGTDPEELVQTRTRISELLAPSDCSVFQEATLRLLEDDSHTVEARFRLSVERDSTAGFLFQPMEGKGMLMIDRENGQASHTMWVVKPIGPARYENDSLQLELKADDLAPEPASSVIGDRAPNEPATPFNFPYPIMVDPILCRICECQIPQWYFEKHSETCAETHRLEAEIVECNETISELRNTIRDLSVAVDRASPNSVPEYRGMPIFIPAASPIVSSPLQLFRANKMQRFGVKKIQKRLLDQLEDILQVAFEVAVPTLKEEEAKEPIERQRLLSPGSERKISQIRNWAKPTTEDAALGQLVQDAERVMRQKIDNVVRMQNTIRYAEKIWREWEERVEALETVEECESDSSSEGDSHETQGDNPSSRPFYEASSGPTPLASSSPAPTPTPSEARPTSIPMPSAPIPIHGPRQPLHTRSSTPSSVSSPLALAAPIIAPSTPDLSLMTLDDCPPPHLLIKARKSAQNLMEPKFVITPPASPPLVARDGSQLTREPSMKRGHRRHSTINSISSPSGPFSPRQSAAPLSRTTPASIKDFEIIKPISKGAFGSVFLAKKKVTGDYYAIKVLKKADMIAKNQITNVKAERMILMTQAESPFVAKLYFTFQSKENLYLVMEYLNGGDCAALIKSLGCLPEEWTRNYIAEVVLGLEYLHQRGVVHRDLKPDNLLIDQHGHLKLTDFGLSRIGLLGRQTRVNQPGRQLARYCSRSRPPSMDSAYLSSPMIYAESATAAGSSYFPQRTNSGSRAANSPYPMDDVESSGSESLSGLYSRRSMKATDSPLQSFATELTNELLSHSNGGTPPGEQKVVGTPDYLAPETILGLRGDDAAVDWWALGVITYEFLYGIPPFHADTPEKVFENILSGHIEWHEDWIDFSEEARDFMRRLMTLDPGERLGANGADEVKAHPFFASIEWDKVTTSEAAFIPQVTDPESTDYFDPRGAIPQLFHDDEPVAITGQAIVDSPVGVPSAVAASVPIPLATKDNSSPPASDDFGSFSFKNLPVLKQANDDVIRKLKTDQMAPLSQALAEQPVAIHQRKRSVSTRIKKPPSVVTTVEPGKAVPTNPPSPSTSVSSVASSPSRASLPPLTSGSGAHSRKPSEYGAVERFKLSQKEGVDRRNSISRLRTASVSSTGDGSGSEAWNSSAGHGSYGSHGSPHDYTAWNNHPNSGDDLQSRLRASTAPMEGYPSHPISLVPGQVSRANVLANFRAGASRRMSIADDIRNAHNIPGPTSLPSSPTLPLYPAFAGAAEFQPRPAPPVPSSTPPPPRPPLPPSLTTAAFRKPVSPPPIPPKPFTAPSSPQEDGRLLGVPASLLPGNHATQILDRLTQSPEPQVGEGEIAVAMALSASVCDQEESQRQKLALQEEEDIIRALKASMLDSGRSHVEDVFPGSSSSRIVPGHRSEVSDEAFARLLVLERGRSTLLDTESAPSQSTTNDDQTATLVSKHKSPTIVPLTGAREPTPSTDPALPGSSPRAAPSTLPAKHEAHVERRVPSPSSSILSDLSHLPPVKEKEEGRIARVESVSEVHLPYADTTRCFTRSPEPSTDALPPKQVPSGSGNPIPGRRGSPSDNAVDRPPPVPPKVKQAYSSPASNSSNLPLYSSRAGTPTGGKSTPTLKNSDPAESSTASGSGELSDAVFSGPLPSYTETPFPAAEENIKQNTSHSSSLVSTQSPSQFPVPASVSRPSSSASASPSIQHRIPFTASQVESQAGSSTGHLSRHSSAHSSPDPDGRSSDLHSVRPGASSIINVNAFVNKDLFVGVSVGFMPPKVSSQLIPMEEEMPPIFSLPYGKSRPLHLQGPSWRRLLKLMASLSGTRVEAALDAIATIKTTPKLRTVIQFVKPNPASRVWRTIFYFTIDYPPPRPSVRHRSVNELPYSYHLTEIPTLLRNAAESPLSRTYTIPASDSVPFPTLPITFPNLALYLQAALEESRRYINDSHSDYRKLAKMITMCYPDEDIAPDPPERRGLFKRVMGLSNKPQKTGGNEDTYELVTPFVPDEWG
ncbi:hypothetical protein C0993_000074 [Termitomyces sp. T159_Od127]|nr:hypothetical protein C0993_000074 [Termitomyces sp. T159_Od127]